MHNEEMRSKKQKRSIIELFEDSKNKEGFLRVAAPMVRYSKLDFRTLVRKYGVDLCFTPMIMADSFCQSEKARRNEFTTNLTDTPLVVQFAARNSTDVLTAAKLVEPYCDGVDLNCGCPQRWALSAGYGAALLRQPEQIADIIRTLRRNLPSSFSVSAKLRLLSAGDCGTAATVDLCRQLEVAGCTFLTLHSRTPWQKSSLPPDIEALRCVKDSIKIPLIANGDVRNLVDAQRLHASTACDGVMAASGLLTNPAMFLDENDSDDRLRCIRDWCDLVGSAGEAISFQCCHHHFVFMLERILPKRDRVLFNNFTCRNEILEFLDEKFDIRPNTSVGMKGIDCAYDRNLCARYKIGKQNEKFSCLNSNGKYFQSFATNESSTDDIRGESVFSFRNGNIFGD